METIPSSPMQSPASPIAKALSKAQGAFKTPELNRTAIIKNANGAKLYETHYADLKEIIDCIRKPLSENGLSFTQEIDFFGLEKNVWVLRLRVRHESGQVMESIMPLKIDQTPQQFGGSLTYFKRYQLSAFFGLAADFDDDGNAAEGKGNKVVVAAPKRGNQKKDSEDFDTYVDPQPNYDVQPITLLEKLYVVVEEKAMPAKEVSSIIEKLTGKKQKAKEMDQKDLETVFKYINLL